MYVNDPDADEIPKDVCVKHVIYAWQLAGSSWKTPRTKEIHDVLKISAVSESHKLFLVH